eukprot:365984_1
MNHMPYTRRQQNQSKISLDHTVYRLASLSLILVLYYGINVWYYNAYRSYDDTYTDCKANPLLMWCNMLQSKLFIDTTTCILIAVLIILVFVITMRHTYALEQSFHTQVNPINKITVIVTPLVLICASVVSIIYSSLFAHSYVSYNNLTEYATKRFIIEQTVRMLNEVMTVLILTVDFMHLHHGFSRCNSSILNAMSSHSARIVLISVILGIISFGSVMYLRMDPEQINTANNLRVAGFLIHMAVTMMMEFTYLFQKANAIPSEVNHEYQQRLIGDRQNNQRGNGCVARAFALIFVVCLWIGVALIWTGIIQDIHDETLVKAADIAMFISPSLLYTLQVLFVCFDMIFIR